jgi:hypothetical protein
MGFRKIRRAELLNKLQVAVKALVKFVAHHLIWEGMKRAFCWGWPYLLKGVAWAAASLF